MSHLKLVTIGLVLLGATIILSSTVHAFRIKRRLLNELRPQWLSIISLMIFFLLGYLFFVSNLVFWNLPVIDLVVGAIFIFGAIFVYLIVELSGQSIDTIMEKHQQLVVESAEKEAIEEQRRRYQNGLEKLDRWTRQLIVSAGDFNQFVEILCAGIMDIVAADLAFVPMLDEAGENLHFLAPKGRGARNLANLVVPRDEGGACSWVIANDEPLSIPDLFNDSRAIKEKAQAWGVSAGLFAPLRHKDQVVGALSAFRNGKPFDDIDQQLLNLFTQRASKTFDNMKLLETLENKVRERTAQLDLQNKLLENIISNIPSHVCWKDENLRYRGCNPGFARLIGFGRPEEVFGRSDEELPWESGLSERLRQVDLEVLMEGRQVVDAEFVMRSASGENRYYLQSCLPLKQSSGKTTGLLSIYHDITQRKRAENELRESEERFRSTFDGSGIGKALISCDGTILEVNQTLCQMLAFPDAFLPGTILEYLHSDNRDSFQAEVDALLRRGWGDGSIHREIRLLRCDGGVLWASATLALVHDSASQPLYMVAEFEDISSRKEVEERLLEKDAHLQYLAYHDPLTNLPNRLLFQDRLTQSLSRARRLGQKVALLFLDLDRFKNINDSLGHEVGDRLLVEVAGRLRQELRATDTLARLGGDEFVAILEGIEDSAQAGKVAQKIKSCFQEEIPVGPYRLCSSFSIGISLFPDDGEDVEELMKFADLAMYRAKELGRNDYQFFTPELNARSHEALLLEGRLRSALKNGQMLLHYQPQVSLASGRLLGVEALLRWNHPEKGWIPPDQFIPLAEETGQIIPMGEWAIRTAFQQARLWLDQGYRPVRLAINVSSRQLLKESFTDFFFQVLEEAKLEAKWIDLEITESLIMEDVDLSRRILLALYERGVQITVDDFGTGHSCLSHLKNLPISRLKINRSFVNDLYESQDPRLIASIVALASNLGLEVIAEGIETTQQLELVREAGCRAGQGFFFSQALPPAALGPVLMHGELGRLKNILFDRPFDFGEGHDALATSRPLN